LVSKYPVQGSTLPEIRLRKFLSKAVNAIVPNRRATSTELLAELDDAIEQLLFLLHDLRRRWGWGRRGRRGRFSPLRRSEKEKDQCSRKRELMEERSETQFHEAERFEQFHEASRCCGLARSPGGDSLWANPAGNVAPVTILSSFSLLSP
jgi:hypothetical protein